MKNIVGLFGTCADTTWREDIAIPMLEAAGVDFFNPVVEHWTEECRQIEAQHATEDRVILQVISSEDVSMSSMSESGWLAFQAYLRGQKMVLCILDMPGDKEPKKDEFGRRLKPNKTRGLIRAHINRLPVSIKLETLFIVATIEEAVQKAIELMK